MQLGQQLKVFDDSNPHFEHNVVAVEGMGWVGWEIDFLDSLKNKNTGRMRIGAKKVPAINRPVTRGWKERVLAFEKIQNAQ